jgi:hypothetical protein
MAPQDPFKKNLKRSMPKLKAVEWMITLNVFSLIRKAIARENWNEIKKL